MLYEEANKVINTLDPHLDNVIYAVVDGISLLFLLLLLSWWEFNTTLVSLTVSLA